MSGRLINPFIVERLEELDGFLEELGIRLFETDVFEMGVKCSYLGENLPLDETIALTILSVNKKTGLSKLRKRLDFDEKRVMGVFTKFEKKRANLERRLKNER